MKANKRLLQHFRGVQQKILGRKFFYEQSVAMHTAPVVAGAACSLAALLARLVVDDVAADVVTNIADR